MLIHYAGSKQKSSPSLLISYLLTSDKSYLHDSTHVRKALAETYSRRYGSRQPVFA